MKNGLVLLTDYKGFFGSKQKGTIYRGGMDLQKIIRLFKERGYEARICKFNELDINEILETNPVILYTSAEDKDGLYKSFIEDVIYNLEMLGLRVIPSFNYLKTHNNKIAMELLRERSDLECVKSIRSSIFGTIEELKSSPVLFDFPVVLKPAVGAMSRGVTKANNSEELIKKARKISRSPNLFHDAKELLRKVKYHSRYSQESFFRSKFIVQNFIKGLENDWKVLVYGKKCFVLYRGNRKNDFRASGSGNFIFRRELPEGLLDFAFKIKEYFKVANISLDIGFDGHRFHLIEFQFVYYGTTTLEKSPFYFEKSENNWILISEKSDLEEIYVNSIADYLKYSD